LDAAGDRGPGVAVARRYGALTARGEAGRMMDKRVAIVIGGSRGIGAAVVRLAASEGYCVLFSYASRADDAVALEQAVASAGGEAHGMQADAANEAALTALFDKAAAMGSIR